MQSDGSPHFLRVPQDRPMYHSTSNPRASRSPCGELSGPTRGPFEIGSPTSTRNPMADWQIREKRSEERRVGKERRSMGVRTQVLNDVDLSYNLSFTEHHDASTPM